MNRIIKYCVTVTCALMVFTPQFSILFADELQEDRAEADQYYQARDFSKSFKLYYNLAKSGDHYSQGQLANMYARGEGKSVNLNDAYAWAVLAAQGGDEALLAQVSDKAKAAKTLEKLKKKYGDKALQAQAEKRERIKRSHEMGGCTGARLGCSRG